MTHHNRSTPEQQGNQPMTRQDDDLEQARTDLGEAWEAPKKSVANSLRPPIDRSLLRLSQLINRITK